MTIRPGEVDIVLTHKGEDGQLHEETVTLRPSLNAMRVLSKRYDGFQPLIGALSRLDFDAFLTVIAVGAGIESKGIKVLEGKIFATGLINLLGDVSKFVVIVSNGGKLPDDEENTRNESFDPNG